MTRNDAREYFAKSGLSYSSLDDGSLERLRSLLSSRLKDSNLLNGSYRVTRHKLRWHHRPTGKWATLRCRAYYFSEREAVTFNSDGFIGFAGWADDINITPILSAFREWVDQEKGGDR